MDEIGPSGSPGIGPSGSPGIGVNQGGYLRDWVTALPLRAQGTLVVALRGCDTVGGDHPTKAIVQGLRYVVGNAADEREVDRPGSFMQRMTWDTSFDFPAKCLDPLPLHYVMHLLHAIEIVGYCHPDEREAWMWERLYLRIVDHMHVYPETGTHMFARLTEDRIAKGTA